jgi:hypothetical protein
MLFARGPPAVVPLRERPDHEDEIVRFWDTTFFRKARQLSAASSFVLAFSASFFARWLRAYMSNSRSDEWITVTASNRSPDCLDTSILWRDNTSEIAASEDPFECCSESGAVVGAKSDTEAESGF